MTPSKTLRALFTAFLTFIVLALLGASYLAVTSIGGIKEVEQASKDFDERNLRFTSEFRARIFRVQSLALRSRITGDESYLKKLGGESADLTVFLEERKELFHTGEEVMLFDTLERKLGDYLTEIAPRSHEEMGEDEGDRIGGVQERISGLSESLQRLGDGLPVMELRWQLQRLFVSFLQILIKGSPQQSAIFEESLEDLRKAVAETMREVEDDPRKVTALENFSEKLARFEAEAKETARGWVARGDSRKRFQDLATREEHRDELIELAQELGDSRREAFGSSLGRYRSLVKGLQYSVFIALGLLFVALFAAAWLAHRTFIKPIELRLGEAEEAVESTEALANVGTLAAGVAHEIRNPLTTIKARLFALNELLGKNDSAHVQVEGIQQETVRLEGIVQDFLDFARPTEPRREATAMAEFLDEIHVLLLPEMTGRGVDFSLESTAEVTAFIDRAQLKQVFFNLLRNAAEACDEVEGAVVLFSERRGDDLLIRVRDNGVGIPDDVLLRVFEPFFTQKKAGTGLGLPICEKIIKGHGGSISCQSTEGTGTTFTIQLPISN